MMNLVDAIILSDTHRLCVIIWKITFVICLILSSILIYEMRTTYPMTENYPVTKQNVKTENSIPYNLNQDFQD